MHEPPFYIYRGMLGQLFRVKFTIDGIQYSHVASSTKAVNQTYRQTPFILHEYVWNRNNIHNANDNSNNNNDSRMD